jgi:hypothetical protein
MRPAVCQLQERILEKFGFSGFPYRERLVFRASVGMVSTYTMDWTAEDFALLCNVLMVSGAHPNFYPSPRR